VVSHLWDISACIRDVNLNDAHQKQVELGQWIRYTKECLECRERLAEHLEREVHIFKITSAGIYKAFMKRWLMS
jgi:hypothetical protein